MHAIGEAVKITVQPQVGEVVRREVTQIVQEEVKSIVQRKVMNIVTERSLASYSSRSPVLYRSKARPSSKIIYSASNSRAGTHRMLTLHVRRLAAVIAT